MESTEPRTRSALAQRVYESFQAGDMDTVQTLLASDIVWHSPGQGAEHFHGIDAVMAEVRRLPNTVRVRLPLRNLDPSGGNLRSVPVKVIDENGVHRVPGVLRLLHDVQEPVVCKLPNCLAGVRQEARLRSQEAFVPR